MRRTDEEDDRHRRYYSCSWFPFRFFWPFLWLILFIVLIVSFASWVLQWWWVALVILSIFWSWGYLNREYRREYDEDDAERILRVRLASGRISESEYRRLLKVLRNNKPQRRTKP